MSLKREVLHAELYLFAIDFRGKPIAMLPMILIINFHRAMFSNFNSSLIVKII